MDEKGEISLREFVKKVKEMDQKYSAPVFNLFLNLLKVDEVFDNTTGRVDLINNPGHKSSDRLSIYRLYSVEQIFYHLQTYPDRNSSKNFKNNFMDDAYDDVLDYKGADRSGKNFTEAEKSRIKKLIRMIHIRLEEKFGEYTKAFRAFDLNKDNDLSFEEFVYGCEFRGITMPISDFKLVYDTIDYDGAGGISFLKFCLLNLDRTKDIFGYIDNNVKKPPLMGRRYTHTKGDIPLFERPSAKPPLGKKRQLHQIEPDEIKAVLRTHDPKTPEAKSLNMRRFLEESNSIVPPIIRE
jgi:Ca2+-binding EF-hand superfamily protein